MSCAAACAVKPEEGKIWYGGDWNIPKCKKNIGQYLLDAMLHHKDQIAQVRTERIEFLNTHSALFAIENVQSRTHNMSGSMNT